MTNFIQKCVARFEAALAARADKGRKDTGGVKYPVGPDSEYEYTAKEPKFDHALWDGIMKRHVTAGKVDGITTNVVDYQKLSKDGDVAKYVEALASANLEDLA